jgi:hypothetical protein
VGAVVLTQRLVGLAAVLGTFCQGPAPAGEPKKVKVTVVVILANDYWDVIDPRLKAIAEEVQKTEPTLRGFTIASIDTQSLAVNEKVNIPLVENAAIQVVIKKPADPENKICLSITPPWQKEILYRSICGKFLPVITRYDTEPSVPPPDVVRALALVQSRQSSGALAAVNLLMQSRCRQRLILAIRVQPCNGK